MSETIDKKYIGSIVKRTGISRLTSPFTKENAMSSTLKQIKVEEVVLGDDTVVSVVTFLGKRIDLDPAIQVLGRELFGLADAKGAPNILLDFEGVDYFGKWARGKLSTLHKRILAKKGQLGACNIHEDVWEPFEIERFHILFGFQKGLIREVALSLFGVQTPTIVTL